MWSAKYEPATLREAVMSDELRLKFSNFIVGANMKNLLLIGPSASGKTCISNCIMNDTYGGNISDYVMNVDTLLDRNTKNLFSMIDNFCRIRTSENRNKILMVDNADFLSEKIQRALCVFVEKYENVKIIMTCINIENIVDVIQSKCVLINIKYLSEEQFVMHLRLICISEKVKYSTDALELLYNTFKGDIRVAINNMQMISTVCDKINVKSILELCDSPDTVTLEKILDKCLDGCRKSAIKYSVKLGENGYAGSEILDGFFNTIEKMDINEKIKMYFMGCISKSIYKISHQCDSMIQLEKCIIKLCEWRDNAV